MGLSILCVPLDVVNLFFRLKHSSALYRAGLAERNCPSMFLLKMLFFLYKLWLIVLLGWDSICDHSEFVGPPSSLYLFSEFPLKSQVCCSNGPAFICDSVFIPCTFQYPLVYSVYHLVFDYYALLEFLYHFYLFGVPYASCILIGMSFLDWRPFPLCFC